MALRATVRSGRIIVDTPTSLPQGTVLDLVIDDEGDELDEAERTALHAAIAESWRSAQTGNSAPAEQVLARLRARHKP